MEKIEPLCPLFNSCGGCQYQDIAYRDELSLKESRVRELMGSGVPVEPIVASPEDYHYRSRIDVRLLRTKDGRVLTGFSPLNRKRLVEADSCAIAMPAISQFLPELNTQAAGRLTPKHRNANLVVKTGDDGRVLWGGIGRRSLCLAEADYLWTIVDGKKIFYSLDTFFQANLAILPEVMKRIRELRLWDPETLFCDVYGGVGLFGIVFYDEVKGVVLIEENIYSVKLAEFNVRYHAMERFEMMTGRAESVLPGILSRPGQKVLFFDPPRQGLNPEIVPFVKPGDDLQNILYLSCDPESLVRDLKLFVSSGWEIERVIPFDFFPRTRHIETLAVLKGGKS